MNTYPHTARNESGRITTRLQLDTDEALDALTKARDVVSELPILFEALASVDDDEALERAARIRNAVLELQVAIVEGISTT